VTVSAACSGLEVYKSQHSMAPEYLAELCKPVANIDGHRHLRSAGLRQLDIVSDYQHTEDASSVMPDLQLGILFLTLKKTVHFLYLYTFYLLLDISSKSS